MHLINTSNVSRALSLCLAMVADNIINVESYKEFYRKALF